MSSMTTYTSTSQTSSSPSGFPSKAILFIAPVFAVLFAAVDINRHGHWSCKTLTRVVQEEVAKRSHLKAYMDEVYVAKDGSERPQPKNAVVRCECTEHGKVRLLGKVDNENIRREFSDIAAMAVGTDRVDNQIDVLYEGAIRELQELLATAPTNMAMNYQVTDLGTVYLTGDLPDPALKERVEAMVRRIPGVRDVVNDLGRELKVPGFLRVHNIWFDFNQWKIRPESKIGLDEASQSIREFLDNNPSGRVRVEGHTDSIATDKYNQWLSEKRANAVLEALVSLGISRDRLHAMGKGKTELLVSPDDTPEKRAENRRIEFHFEKAH